MSWGPPTTPLRQDGFAPPIADPEPPRRTRSLIAIAVASLLIAGGAATAVVVLTGDRFGDEAPSPEPDMAQHDADEPADRDELDAVADNGDAADIGVAEQPREELGELTPPPEEQIEADELEPEALEEEDAVEGSAPDEAELTGTVRGYVRALDAGDLAGAHALLAPALQQRPGWSLTEFVDFWDGLLAGAILIEITDVDPSAAEVSALVHYLLSDNELSVEQLTFGLERRPDGAVLIEDYTVVRAERRS